MFFEIGAVQKKENISGKKKSASREMDALKFS